MAVVMTIAIFVMTMTMVAMIMTTALFWCIFWLFPGGICTMESFQQIIIWKVFSSGAKTPIGSGLGDKFYIVQSTGSPHIPTKICTTWKRVPQRQRQIQGRWQRQDQQEFLGKYGRPSYSRPNFELPSSLPHNLRFQCGDLLNKVFRLFKVSQ